MINDRAVLSGWLRVEVPSAMPIRRSRARCLAVVTAMIAAFAMTSSPATAREAAPQPSAKASPSADGKHERGSARAGGSESGRRAGSAGDSAANANGNENASPFGSFGGTNRGPVNIRSDSLSLDYKNTTTTFIGHVHATQADGVLTADKLMVKHGKDFNEVRKMFADGDVRISQGLRWCTSDHAVLDQQAHTVVLTGSPVCHDANDQIAGSRITVHLDSGKSEVEGVKALIFPRPSKTRDNEASADHMK